MAQEKLDLLEITSCLAAELRTGASQIIWRELAERCPPPFFQKAMKKATGIQAPAWR
jgi:hypothetical protein